MAAEVKQSDNIEGNQPRDGEVLVLWEPPGEMEGDTILTVGSTKIAVNKIYLSQLSDYFRALFYGNFRESQTNEFVIREVDEDEFIELLLVLLPTRKPIDENNVESLLELADRFIIESLKMECHSYLGTTDSRGLFFEYSSARSSESSDVIIIWNAPCGEVESDTVIEVGRKKKKKFAVNKVYLAQYSKLFYDMFYGRENPKTLVKAVSADEFDSLLCVILPTRWPITVDNAESILKASGKLQIPSLHRECVDLLTRGTPVLQILKIAFRANSDELKEHCRTRLPSKVHINTMRRKMERYDLSISAKRWLSQLSKSVPKCSVPRAELERSVRPRVFFDITLSGSEVGRIVMELFSDMEPKAAENFRSLCTGERGLDLQGNPLHLKGTNLVTCDGSVVGSCLNETIYGTDRLKRESSEDVYDLDMPYLLQVNHLNYLTIGGSCGNPNYFPFGHVVEGLEVVHSLFTGRNHYIVADCGEL